MDQDIIGQETLKNRVIIIHHNSEIRDHYRVIINASSRFMVAGTHSSFDTAIPNLNISQPDIIIMDIDLPEMSGTDGIQKIKRLYPSAEIIVITEREDGEFILKALGSGATGYITKSSDYVELLGALEEVTKGGAPLSSKIAKILVTRVS
ncbi:MAG: response regulator transcription factor [Bacteroidota bacterium]